MKIKISFIRRIVVLSFIVSLWDSMQAAPAFPVMYSANSRYLVDQNGTPFPIMGRTAWFVVSLSVADYRTFVDDTAARGYSAIELHVINHDPRGNRPPFCGNGTAPFLNRLDGSAWNGVLCCSSADFTTPNEAYWSFVDGFLSYCESKGILVFLFPAYVGYQGGDQGWMQEIVANGPTKMQAYGAWIAARYKDQKNLVWMMGGDMGTAPYTFNSAQTAVEGALLTGLKSVAGQQSVFFSAEWESESIGTDQTSFGTQMTLNGAYSHTGYVNTQGRRAYAHNPVEPSYLIEGPYDQEGLDGNGWNDAASQPVRRFQWWAWLSTIGGYISGNGYVWPFKAPDWQNHLDTQGSRDMARLNAFMVSIPWYNLVPSELGGMRTLITAGGSTVSSSTYVAASATPDGSLLVAYIPPDHTGSITVDMAALGGPARARWFDPTSAAYTSIGTGLPNTGPRSFTPPGNNSSGNQDWVLVLDAGSGNVSVPPTISNIPDQSTTMNTPTPGIPFTINDTDTPVASLTLGRTSSNPALIPTGNIVFGGSGNNRTVTLTPAAGLTGTSTITVTVSDGTNSATTSFALTVGTLVTGMLSFTNAAAITIPDAGAATPYPSTINLSGVGGTVSNVTVTLRNLTHTWTRDIDVLLVGPGGQKVMICSDAGNGGANNVTFTLSDAAASALPRSPLVAGTYRPGDYETGDVLPEPAPSGPYATTLSAFDGQTPNGAWSLYVLDDGPGDLGSFAGGWSLALTTMGAGGPVPDPPTISNIPDQSTTMNTPTPGIPFTINDAQTPAGSLTLGKASSNPALVPIGNIVFGGSGSNRTVTITPAAGLTGTSTITVTVSDGTNNASDTFVLTITAVNTPPTITGLPAQSINEDATAGPLNFTIADRETAVSSLTLGKASSNPTLVPAGNIVFGGSGASRTVTVTPAANQNGTALITLSVSDGQFTVSTNFLLTVSAVNDPPTITGLANQTINVNGTTGPLNFTVGDVETPAASLTLSGASSNPLLVPVGSIAFGGSGGSRTVTVNPAAGQTGSATITVGVGDGINSATTSFVLTVSSSLTGTKSFTNATAIAIPDRGAATPYPSTINVAGLAGTISNVTLTLRNLSHTWTTDLDILLVGPGGQKVVVMSDAGSGGANNITFTLSDAAAAALPLAPLTSSTYRPANYTDDSSGGDDYPSPAPAVPYAAILSAFNGQSPNGAWSLYVFDDGPGDLGSFAGGWILTLTTSGQPDVRIEKPSRIMSVILDASRTMRLTVQGRIGVRQVLEASSDWIHWTQVDAQDNSNGVVVLSEPPTTNTARYYRVVSTP